MYKQCSIYKSEIILVTLFAICAAAGLLMAHSMYPKCVEYNKKLISTQCDTATFSDRCILSCDYKNQTASIFATNHCFGCSNVRRDITEKSCGYGYYVYFDNSNKLQIGKIRECVVIKVGAVGICLCLVGAVATAAISIFQKNKIIKSGTLEKGSSV